MAKVSPEIQEFLFQAFNQPLTDRKPETLKKLKYFLPMKRKPGMSDSEFFALSNEYEAWFERWFADKIL